MNALRCIHKKKPPQNIKASSLVCRLFSTSQNVLLFGKTKSAQEQQIKSCLTNTCRTTLVK